jgi:hypothetical protein
VNVTETYWRHPVQVRLKSGLERSFVCIEDSLDCLEHNWPIKNARHQKRAIDLCRAVLTRSASSEVAREAFVAACIEAGMLPVPYFRKLAVERPLVSRLQ